MSFADQEATLASLPWAVVTGASAGIGAAIAERLTKSGHRVLNVDRSPATHPFRHAELIVDLENPENAAKELGRFEYLSDVSVFVHNAGVLIPARLEAVSLEAVIKELTVMTVAFIALTKEIIPAMQRRRYGRIVAIGSRAALGKQERTGYAAAKASLTGLVRTWALELGPYGITVNVVAPGPTETALLRENNVNLLDGLAARIPVGFVATPHDQAAAVDFFCSPASRFITGQVLNVCGGASIGLLDR